MSEQDQVGAPGMGESEDDLETHKKRFFGQEEASGPASEEDVPTPREGDEEADDLETHRKKFF